MTDRVKLLEAVAEAARKISDQLLLAEMTIEDRCDTDVEGAYDAMVEEMRPLIRALDAHDATQPAQAETVTLAVWRHADGGVQLVEAASEAEHFTEGIMGWTRLGAVTLPLDRERGA